MPLEELGAGETTDSTTRTVAATDSPEVEALGTTEDPAADKSPVSEASIAAILKRMMIDPGLMGEVLLELRRIRVGIGELARIDLERAVPSGQQRD